MKKNGVWLIVLLMMGLLAHGCASPQPAEQAAPSFQAQPLDKGMWQPKVDNLVIIMDSSTSMNESANGASKFATARNVVSTFNQTMPDLNVQTAVRSVGYDPATAKGFIKVYGMAPYSRKGVADGLAKLKETNGPSLLGKTLTAAGGELKDLKGKTAIVVVTDGKEMGSAPLTAADALKATYGDRICIHTVLVGDDSEGKAMLQKMAKVTPCGSALTAADVSTAPKMADFVKAVLLAPIPDSDGDGVPDNMDKCPNTPKGVPVDSNGCPLDSDGDGVTDDRDRCPGTPKGTAVDADGCPLAPKPSKSAIVTPSGTWLYKDVKFDLNKATLTAASLNVLDEIVTALKEQPGLKIEVHGHTDISGTHAYNMKLSDQRAKAVVDYFKSKGIDPARMSAKGFGPDQPMDSNKTTAGRANNRRVEIKPIP